MASSTTASLSTVTTTLTAVEAVKTLQSSLKATALLKGAPKIRATLACRECAAIVAALPDATHARVSVACKGMERGENVTATLTVTVRAFALCVAFGGAIAPRMILA